MVWQSAMMIGAGLLVLLIGALAIAACCCKKVRQGTALLRRGVGGTRVSFSAMVAVPWLQRITEVDLTAKRIPVVHWGQGALHSRDGIALYSKIIFLLRIEPTAAGVRRALERMAAEESTGPDRFNDIFRERLSRAVASTFSELDYDVLYHRQEELKSRLEAKIAPLLAGFVLERIAIDHLARPAAGLQGTGPLSSLPAPRAQHEHSQSREPRQHASRASQPREIGSLHLPKQ